MNNSVDIIQRAGRAVEVAKSRKYAKLDFAQSASGLVLALFMWQLIMEMIIDYVMV